MKPRFPRQRFTSLSVKDLLDARDAYHVHLLHLENVVATAVGKYRFVKTESEKDAKSTDRGREDPKTLANSEVRSYSWPCVMVFVDRWIPKSEFGRKVDEIVPPRLYLPDGRVVPTCVVLAEKQSRWPGAPRALRYPRSILGGGYPVLSEVQGQTRLSTI